MVKPDFFRRLASAIGRPKTSLAETEDKGAVAKEQLQMLKSSTSSNQQLFLHVGDCKTGSTAIQSMLSTGNCAPEGVTLFTPGDGSHHGLAQSLGDRPEYYPKRWDNIAQRFAERDWDVGVLSSELFEFIDPSSIAHAVRTHLADYADTIKVVIYVRPHISRLLSQFAENIKLGHHKGDMYNLVEIFRQNQRLQYADRLDRWRSEFGDRLIVRPFVRNQLVGGDVRRDFLSVLFGDDAPVPKDIDQDDNAALTLSDLALMQLLQQWFEERGNLPLDNKVSFGKEFGRLLRDIPPVSAGEKLRLPKDLYDTLLTECRPDAERMDAEWWGTPCFVPALKEAANRVTDTAQSLDAADYHGPETLRLMKVWADLIMRQMEDRPEAFADRLRRR